MRHLPPTEWILRFPEKAEVSRALSLERPTSTYRPTRSSMLAWSLFRHHFPRVPLAPNWNWPLHPINSLPGDFVLHAGRSLASHLSSSVFFRLVHHLLRDPMISQQDYGYSRRKTVSRGGIRVIRSKRSKIYENLNRSLLKLWIEISFSDSHSWIIYILDRISINRFKIFRVEQEWNEYFENSRRRYKLTICSLNLSGILKMLKLLSKFGRTDRGRQMVSDRCKYGR